MERRRLFPGLQPWRCGKAFLLLTLQGMMDSYTTRNTLGAPADARQCSRSGRSDAERIARRIQLRRAHHIDPPSH